MHMFMIPPMRFHLRRKFWAVLVAVAALLALPAVANTAGLIVISGANSGSTLTLSMRGNKIVVKGNMAHHRLRGCHFTRGHRVAVCRTGGKSAVEVDMGPSPECHQSVT